MTNKATDTIHTQTCTGARVMLMLTTEELRLQATQANLLADNCALVFNQFGQQIMFSRASIHTNKKKRLRWFTHTYPVCSKNPQFWQENIDLHMAWQKLLYYHSQIYVTPLNIIPSLATRWFNFFPSEFCHSNLVLWSQTLIPHGELLKNCFYLWHHKTSSRHPN